MENKKVKVKVTHLTKKFGDLLVLNDVSFDVYDGEFLCIVGPTGCGKTTFLNSLTHLYEPTAGNILLDGEEIDLRKHNIAYIFQEYSAMEWLTVRENVRFGLDIKRDYKNIDEKVNNALDLVGLTPFADYYPKQLSASMLQRVVIARAFATQPRSSADGRALRPAGHQPPLQARGRGHPSVQADQNDRPFHHP